MQQKHSNIVRSIAVVAVFGCLSIALVPCGKAAFHCAASSVAFALGHDQDGERYRNDAREDVRALGGEE